LQADPERLEPTRHGREGRDALGVVAEGLVARERGLELLGHSGIDPGLVQRGSQLGDAPRVREGEICCLKRSSEFYRVQDLTDREALLRQRRLELEMRAEVGDGNVGVHARLAKAQNDLKVL